MDVHTDSHQVQRLEVVERGRRRRWSEAEKLRIVRESLAGSRVTSATARRHGISRQLLLNWRKAWREGRLGGGEAGVGFVPAIVTAAPQPVGAHSALKEGRVEIVTGNGRRIIVDAGIDVVALLRLVRGLEQL
jgi:transposase